MTTNLEPLTKNEIRTHAAHYDQAKPAVYVGTYHKYNCGSLYGMWVDITTFDEYEEFCDFCRRLHRDENDPEFMVQDFEYYPESWYHEGGLPSEKEFERRELLDTYRTFGCESGQPTFRYDLKDGVNDPDGPFLVNPVIYDARTNITSQLLADEGYAVHRVIDGEDVDENFGIRDFEKTFFNEETNHVFCDTFMKYAARDPLSGEIGKTIIFTVSQKHAEKIVQILNQIAMEQFPGKYNSDFAIQITSNVRDAQQFSINFSENNLRGHTRWLPDYESSRARVAVTVGMMTTGYDCSDLLNLVFMRPVFSPSDFIQMKGRGTRLHTFKYVH